MLIGYATDLSLMPDLVLSAATASESGEKINMHLTNYIDITSKTILTKNLSAKKKKQHVIS